MADIPGSINKLTDVEIAADAPLTEALLTKIGANINALIDLGGNSQVFTANGSFTVPENVNRVLVYAAGGGGGGGGGRVTGGSQTSGGGGGSGAALVPIFIPTTPLNVISVTIGAGGGGGAVTVAGSDGANTSFGSWSALRFLECRQKVQ